MHCTVGSSAVWLRHAIAISRNKTVFSIELPTAVMLMNAGRFVVRLKVQCWVMTASLCTEHRNV